jgi:L-ascorbate metabolism protein UlaG (beta-lactamase superfamily)
VLRQAGVLGKQVVELRAGEGTTVGGVRVRALPADHRHRDIPNCIAFAATLDGFTVVHAGDNRLFAPPALTGAERADILIHSLYAYDEVRAREGALTWVPEMLDEQARFLADLRPRVVLLTHLAEFHHPYHKLWRFMHAGLLKERLFHLAPEVECPVLGPGERYVYRR